MTTAPASPRPARTRGFTLIEILIVVAIIGILANLAVPEMQRALVKARASALLQDLRTVERAAIRYASDTGSFPRERAIGREPKELAPILRGAVRWDRRDIGYELDWENWQNPDGSPKRRRTGVLIGVSVRTEDDALLNAIARMAPRALTPTLKGRYTFTIVPVS